MYYGETNNDISDLIESLKSQGHIMKMVGVSDNLIIHYAGHPNGDFTTTRLELENLGMKLHGFKYFEEDHKTIVWFK